MKVLMDGKINFRVYRGVDNIVTHLSHTEGPEVSLIDSNGRCTVGPVSMDRVIEMWAEDEVGDKIEVSDIPKNSFLRDYREEILKDHNSEVCFRET